MRLMGHGVCGRAVDLVQVDLQALAILQDNRDPFSGARAFGSGLSSMLNMQPLDGQREPPGHPSAPQV